MTTNFVQSVLLRQFQLVRTVLRNSMCTNTFILTETTENASPIDTGSDGTLDWKAEMKYLKELESKSVLEPPSSTELYTAPPLQPTFNLAAYVNNSETLQQLLKLGVDLSRIERKIGLAQFILKLDFEKDIKNHIKFVEANPFWLMFRTQRIDRRLGYFQKKFQLTGQQVRYLAAKHPRIITYHLQSIEKNTFSVCEEFGFSRDETRMLILQTPNIFMINQDNLVARLDYIHNKMNISHNQIVQFSEILKCREHRIRQRHEFLKLIGRAQYDPSKDLYIPLKRVVEGTDVEFVTNVAKIVNSTLSNSLV